MTDMGCDAFRTQSAELALGVLVGRDRSDALAHLEHCPACRHDLLLMGDLADRLAELAPPAEPPAGFETRVLAALTPPVRSRPAHRPMRVLTAAALAVVIGLGGWIVGHVGGRGGPAGGSPQVVTAAFVTGQRHIGQVIATTGTHPWIYMDVDTGLGDQTVLCQLRQPNGTTVSLGSFRLSNGSGYWAAPIPPGASSVRGARLVDAGGRTVATASFRS